jgi:uncharacterized protein (DUF1501 family)
LGETGLRGALWLDRRKTGGLADAQLYEGRDLRPTTDLRAVLKGLLADQFGLGAGVLALAVFPDSGDVAPMQGLIA